MSRKIAKDMLFQKVQQDLVSLNGVNASLVASRDGYLLTRATESKLEMYARASSSMLRAADAAISRMGLDCSERIVVDYPSERLIAIRAGPKALVAVLTGPGTNLEKILTKLDSAAERVREII